MQCVKFVFDTNTCSSTFRVTDKPSRLRCVNTRNTWSVNTRTAHCIGPAEQLPASTIWPQTPHSSWSSSVTEWTIANSGTQEVYVWHQNSLMHSTVLTSTCMPAWHMATWLCCVCQRCQWQRMLPSAWTRCHTVCIVLPRVWTFGWPDWQFKATTLAESLKITVPSDWWHCGWRHAAYLRRSYRVFKKDIRTRTWMPFLPTLLLPLRSTMSSINLQIFNESFRNTWMAGPGNMRTWKRLWWSTKCEIGGPAASHLIWCWAPAQIGKVFKLALNIAFNWGLPFWTWASMARIWKE